MISKYPAVVVFIAAGLCAVIFAYNSYGLFLQSMANIRLVRENGFQALMDGGLAQFVRLLLSGAISLAAYIGFKTCEGELVERLTK